MVEYKKRPLADRFWEKVRRASDDECWEWIGSRQLNDYGVITLRTKPLLAHRVSWMLHFGEIPEGMCVCHHCDNPPCVNPRHLFLGSKTDNNVDRDRKGRTAVQRGVMNGCSKLTREYADEIRRRYIEGNISQQSLAEEFEVSQGTICRVVNYKSWM